MWRIIAFISLIVLWFIVLLWPLRSHAQDAAVGDSIALGTGQALGVPTYARSSMSSCWVLRHSPSGPFDRVVFSAGINDAPGPSVKALFDRVRARVVVVILPAGINSARAHVASEAAAHGFRPVSYTCAGGCTKRNFHPASYAVLAAAVRRAWSGR